MICLDILSQLTLVMSTTLTASTLNLSRSLWTVRVTCSFTVIFLNDGSIYSFLTWWSSPSRTETKVSNKVPQWFSVSRHQDNMSGLRQSVLGSFCPRPDILFWCWDTKNQRKNFRSFHPTPHSTPGDKSLSFPLLKLCPSCLLPKAEDS